MIQLVSLFLCAVCLFSCATFSESERTRKNAACFLSHLGNEFDGAPPPRSPPAFPSPPTPAGDHLSFVCLSVRPQP